MSKRKGIKMGITDKEGRQGRQGRQGALKGVSVGSEDELKVGMEFSYDKMGYIYDFTIVRVDEDKVTVVIDDTLELFGLSKEEIIKNLNYLTPNAPNAPKAPKNNRRTENK